jgi:hypothetical protein
MEAFLAATAGPTIGPTKVKEGTDETVYFCVGTSAGNLPDAAAQLRGTDVGRSDCGRTDLAHLPAKYFFGETCSAPCDGEEHFFDLKKDPNLERPLPKSAIRYGEDDEIYYRGVKCREFTAKEYERIKD